MERKRLRAWTFLSQNSVGYESGFFLWKDQFLFSTAGSGFLDGWILFFSKVGSGFSRRLDPVFLEGWIRFFSKVGSGFSPRLDPDFFKDWIRFFSKVGSGFSRRFDPVCLEGSIRFLLEGRIRIRVNSTRTSNPACELGYFNKSIM